MATNYHNEVLRKARVLERQRMARAFSQEPSEDKARVAEIIRNIQHERGSSGPENSPNNRLGCSADVIGVGRNRQTYDHSRNGPIRDDSNRTMRREVTSTFGNKPNHMYSVWKG